jgi:hypothetical protein
MTIKKYKVDNLIFFRRDIRILALQLRERARINKVTYDNKTFTFIVELDVSDAFHSELSKLGYTTI